MNKILLYRVRSWDFVSTGSNTNQNDEIPCGALLDIINCAFPIVELLGSSSAETIRSIALFFFFSFFFFAIGPLKIFQNRTTIFSDRTNGTTPFSKLDQCVIDTVISIY